ncbi:arginine/serine-rich protein 1 isoform X2 [Conger conger]|uniref:arginine/serine-rich protein 1 isoform X2 n=1 Tax=Conger conger TaxID=82655 RepID=UPI002A59F997|nr:arginine/serine-rich protein 1 isoform X2 [Conger conger]XP_061103888.1 arginine/serine-rich protein 1 isoform X2 [Conger conger]
MAVQSHSFQGNLERTEKPEKIRLVANPAKEQENTAGEFHQKRKDEKLKGGEHQRTEAGEWRSEERDGPPASDRECRSRSRSVSTATRSSSVTSGSSGGRRGNRRNHGKRRSRRSRRSRSNSGSSRSRAPARSRCRRGGRRSPPRRYRARSRSYSPSHSPARRCPRGSPARARSRSTNLRGVLAQSRLRLALSPERRSRTRSSSRSREPDSTGAHLSLPEKRQVLLASRESAARARGGWEEVPAALEDPEGPVFAPRARPQTSPRESHSKACIQKV